MMSTGSGTSCPTIAAVAVSMKFLPSTLDTNGNDRDARRLHSMTLNSAGAPGLCRRVGASFGKGVLAPARTMWLPAASEGAGVPSACANVGGVLAAMALRRASRGSGDVIVGGRE